MVKETRLESVRLDRVEPRSVKWLWAGRIPFGRLTMLDGDPGVGKSQVALDLGCRLTVSGEMPDGTVSESAPAGVVLVSGEDGLADTIRPRIDNGGGDPTRFLAIRGVRYEKGLSSWTVRNVAEVADGLQQVGARLLILDPITAHMGEANTHRDADVRGALADLLAFAEERDVAVLGIRHLRKGGGTSAVQAGGGSIAFSGAARSVLISARDPDHPDGYILAHAKSNLSPKAPSLRYRIYGNKLASSVVYSGESLRTADELIDKPNQEERSALDDATGFLKEALADGASVSVADLGRMAASAGHKWRTVERAKGRLGIRPRKQGFSDGWAWSIPCSNGDGHLRAIEPRSGAEVGDESEGALDGVLGSHLGSEDRHRLVLTATFDGGQTAAGTATSGVIEDSHPGYR